MTNTRKELYALCEDLYGFVPDNDYEIYFNIDMTFDLLGEILGRDLHFEPLIEEIKIQLDEILSDSNGKEECDKSS